MPSPDDLLARIDLRRAALLPAEVGAGFSWQLFDAQAADHADEFVLLDDSPTGGRHEVIAVQVVGVSMIGEHILPGDTALFRPADTAQTGEIVAAPLEDGTVTIKRFERVGDGSCGCGPPTPRCRNRSWCGRLAATTAT